MYLPEYTETVQDTFIQNSYTDYSHGNEVQESQVFFTHFWTKLFGVTRVELYTEVQKSQPHGVLD